MKKLIILFLAIGFSFTSCGPRRYKCGPYRRCETVKPTFQKSNDAIIALQRNEITKNV